MPLFWAHQAFWLRCAGVWHQALELGVISGFSGWDYTAFGLIGKGSDSPIERLFLRF